MSSYKGMIWAPTAIISTSSLIGVILFGVNNGSQVLNLFNQPGVFKGIFGLQIFRFIFSLGQLNFRKNVIKLIVSNQKNDDIVPKVPKEKFIKKVQICNIGMIINMMISSYLVYQNIKINDNNSNNGNISLNNENYVTKYFNYIESINLFMQSYILLKRLVIGDDGLYENAKPYLKVFDR